MSTKGGAVLLLAVAVGAFGACGEPPAPVTVTPTSGSGGSGASMGSGGSASTAGGGHAGGANPTACPDDATLIYEVSNDEHIVGDMQTDGVDVFFVETRLGEGHRIYRAPVCGGAATTLVTDMGSASPQLALDGADIIYITGNPDLPSLRDVWRLPKTGGTPERIVEQTPASTLVEGDDFWYGSRQGQTENNPDRAYRLSLDGGTSLEIASGPRMGRNVVYRDGFVYGLGVRIDATNGAVETYETVPFLTGQYVAVDAQNLYWTEFNGPTKAVPLAGGAVVQILPPARHRGLAVDEPEGWVYVTADEGFWRTSPDGAVVQDLGPTGALVRITPTEVVSTTRRTVQRVSKASLD